jgi:hypothetical protein
MRTLSDTFRLYFAALRGAVAPSSAVPKPQSTLRHMVWHYILSLSGRLDRLITRWKNGSLPTPRGPRAARASATTRNLPRFPLPSGKNWLARRMPATGIGAYGGQLRHLLTNDAELQAFLAAAPQARRMLGPLCRAFGIDIHNPLAIPPTRQAARLRPKAEPFVTPPPPPRVEPPPRSTIPIPHPFVAFLRR